jgi:hypothetical protein
MLCSGLVTTLMNGLFKRVIFRYAALCGLIACGLVSSCNANFIPVPPPSDPTFESIQVADALGSTRQVWQASGSDNAAMKGARVSLYNSTLGIGTIVKASPTGRYVSGLLEGAVGDKIEMYYESPSAEKSPSICRKLQVGVASTRCD